MWTCCVGATLLRLARPPNLPPVEQEEEEEEETEAEALDNFYDRMAERPSSDAVCCQPARPRPRTQTAPDGGLLRSA